MCRANRVRPEGSDGACTKCASGTRANDAANPTACVCRPGFGRIAGKAACRRCQARRGEVAVNGVCAGRNGAPAG